MNGFEFMVYLKNSGFFQHVPIIVVSSVENESNEKIYALGADDLIRKPYNPIKLRSSIENILNPKLKLQF
jgi:CheY-like chemotaxis protein